VLNDDRSDCGLICLVCSSGPDPAGVRRLIAGQMTAFFRGTLQGDVEALAILTDARLAPSPIVAASWQIPSLIYIPGVSARPFPGVKSGILIGGESLERSSAGPPQFQGFT
jgi:hypothetical protein